MQTPQKEFYGENYGSFELVHFADTGISGTIFPGNDTGKTYEQLTKNTRNDLCLRVVCELFYI